jgi:DNA-directed RNA polymerase specialized sigma24 family protein
LEQLPVKRRIYAKAVWLRGIPARRVAEIFGISEAAVSQHLKKARDSLQNYLRESGFEVAGSEKKVPGPTQVFSRGSE